MAKKHIVESQRSVTAVVFSYIWARIPSHNLLVQLLQLVEKYTVHFEHYLIGTSKKYFIPTARPCSGEEK